MPRHQTLTDSDVPIVTSLLLLRHNWLNRNAYDLAAHPDLLVKCGAVRECDSSNISHIES